jgi:glycopeptide antibiotics resistance protein
MIKRDVVPIAAAVAAAAIAISLGTAHRLYEIPGLAGHVVRIVVLRKIASLVVFAALGIIFDVIAARLGRKLQIVDAAILVGAVSAVIELVQDMRGSTEGLLWNLGDVMFGAVGGALGVVVLRLASGRRTS